MNVHKFPSAYPSKKGFMVLLGVLIAIMSSPLMAQAQEKPATSPAQIGPPDYAKMTGAFDHASLPSSHPRVLWKYGSDFYELSPGQPPPPSMCGLSDVTVCDGVVYVGMRSDPSKVIALKAKDGSRIWEYVHSAGGISHAPSITKEFVFFGSESGITAIKRDDGTLLWSHAIEHGGGESSPIPIGDAVYYSGYDGKAYALNQSDGKVIWSHDFAKDAPEDQKGFSGERARFQQIAARPRGAACDGELFIQSVFDQSRLVAIDCKSGERRWSFQAKGWIGPAPTISGKYVYVASQDKHLYCLDRLTGKLVWKFKTNTWLSSRVAVRDQKVFLTVHGARLYQLDAETGKVLHLFQAPEKEDRKTSVYSFPIVTEKLVYFATGKGKVFAVDPTTNQMQWSLRPSEDSELFTDPATDGQRIFVVSRQGNAHEGECAVLAIGTSEDSE